MWSNYVASLNTNLSPEDKAKFDEDYRLAQLKREKDAMKEAERVEMAELNRYYGEILTKSIKSGNVNQKIVAKYFSSFGGTVLERQTELLTKIYEFLSHPVLGLERGNGGNFGVGKHQFSATDLTSFKKYIEDTFGETELVGYEWVMSLVEGRYTDKLPDFYDIVQSSNTPSKLNMTRIRPENQYKYLLEEFV